MAKKLYPFSATWSGLTKKGKEREIAQAKYELSGIELKKKLAVIDADTVEDKAKAEVQVDFDEGVIDKTEYDKRCAIVDKTPWVEVKKMQVNEDDPKQGYMELDWNDEFVAMLTEKGYTGESDESVVNGWFNDVCSCLLYTSPSPRDRG